MGHVILGLLLLAGPQTIYSLHKRAEEGVSLFYRASLGSLRGALTGLLDRGHVTFVESVERGRRKKTYQPTEAGATEFFAWMAAPITGSDLETAALSKLFFLGLLPDSAARRAVLDDIVARIERDEAELLAVAAGLDALELPPEHQLVLGYQRATLDYGLGTHRFALEHFRALRDAEQP